MKRTPRVSYSFQQGKLKFQISIGEISSLKISPNLQQSRFRRVRRDSYMEIYTLSFHLISANEIFVGEISSFKISPNLQQSRFRRVRRDSDMEIYTLSFHLISTK